MTFLGHGHDRTRAVCDGVLPRNCAMMVRGPADPARRGVSADLALRRSETGDIAAFGVAGMGCSAFFPLCISLSGQGIRNLRRPWRGGGIVAFYQAGYGVSRIGDWSAAGIRRTFVPDQSTRMGSVVAGAMFIVALAVVIRSTHSTK
jgi:hypothetical protein